MIPLFLFSPPFRLMPAFLSRISPSIRNSLPFIFILPSSPPSPNSPSPPAASSLSFLSSLSSLPLPYVLSFFISISPCTFLPDAAWKSDWKLPWPPFLAFKLNVQGDNWFFFGASMYPSWKYRSLKGRGSQQPVLVVTWKRIRHGYDFLTTCSTFRHTLIPNAFI